MSRRPARAVEVRCAPTGEPVQFLRGRKLYVVKAILAHWREATRWWSNSANGSGLEVERTAIDRDVWRVEASMGRTAVPGVFDLARLSRSSGEPGSGQPGSAEFGSGQSDAGEYWVLVRVYD